MKNLIISTSLAIIMTVWSIWLTTLMLQIVVNHLEIGITQIQTMSVLTLGYAIALLFKTPPKDKHQNLEKAIFSMLESFFREIMGVGILVIAFKILISII
jgi:hypothetical protein